MPFDKLEGVSEQDEKALGKTKLEDEGIRKTLQQAKVDGMNARQHMARIKGSFGEGGEPAFPIEVEGMIPEKPNVFTDGGLQCPTTQWWALGGFGVWWPHQKNDEPYQQQMPEEAHAHQDVTDEGIGLWGKMRGQANNSTRMEVAGTIIAMQR